MRGLFYGIGHKPNSGANAACFCNAPGTYCLLRLLLAPAARQLRAFLAWPCPLHPPKPHRLQNAHPPFCCFLYADFLAGQIALDKDGYVVVEHGGRTSVEGVFAAGDLHDVEWRQVGALRGARLLPRAWKCGRQAAGDLHDVEWRQVGASTGAGLLPWAWKCGRQAAGDLRDVEWRQVGASTGAGLLPWAWEAGGRRRETCTTWSGGRWVIWPQGVVAAVWPLAWECS